MKSLQTLIICFVCSGVMAEQGVWELTVRDANDAVVPARVHLFDSSGEVVKHPTLPFFRDHFASDGTVQIKLPFGVYRYKVARGHEYRQVEGAFQLNAENSAKTSNVELVRISNLRTAGWYSGDLHVHRGLNRIERLMRSEDLDFAPVITWWNKNNPWAKQPIPSPLETQFDGHRIYHAMAGEDERGGGALMYFGLNRPLPISDALREHPSPLKYAAVADAENKDVWIDVEKPFWWDVPTWLASGRVDSVGIANNHMNLNGMYEDEAWGRPRDAERLPPPLGNGFWTQEIYYHILNSGLRIPPSAGSASGVLPNPLGYNRVYVHIDGRFSSQSWWDGLRAGRCFVTNGPLLVCRANGKFPGSVFKNESVLDLRLDLQLASNDPVEKLELVVNGDVVGEIPVDKPNLQARLKMEGAGWFLVRARTNKKNTFQFASTGPFYVETSETKFRISERSVNFFRDWVGERMSNLQTNLANQETTVREDVLRYHLDARRFWDERLRMKNAP